MCDKCECSHSADYGACSGFVAGFNGRCVFCDHAELCHPGVGPVANGPLSPVRIDTPARARGSAKSEKTKQKIVRADRSLLNPNQWSCDLECGHDVWITSKQKPKKPLIVISAEFRRNTKESNDGNPVRKVLQMVSVETSAPVGDVVCRAAHRPCHTRSVWQPSCAGASGDGCAKAVG